MPQSFEKSHHFGFYSTSIKALNEFHQREQNAEATFMSQIVTPQLRGIADMINQHKLSVNPEEKQHACHLHRNLVWMTGIHPLRHHSPSSTHIVVQQYDFNTELGIFLENAPEPTYYPSLMVVPLSVLDKKSIKFDLIHFSDGESHPSITQINLDTSHSTCHDTIRQTIHDHISLSHL